jgi:hypothetical protein
MRTLVILIILASLLLVKNAFSAERNYKSAVIHHTASHDVSAKEIDRWHKERGFDSIGYHWVIRANGAIEKGRDIWKQGAHAKGRNQKTGIVLTGYDKFSKAQKKSLKGLLTMLKITDVERHHDKCPGKGLDLEKL